MSSITKKTHEQIKQKLGFTKSEEIKQDEGVIVDSPIVEASPVLPPQNDGDEVATEINSLHASLSAMVGQTLDYALKIGKMLTQKKFAVPHGQFEIWVQNNLNFTLRTAQNYMRVYNKRRMLNTKQVSSLTAAYRTLGIMKKSEEMPQAKEPAKINLTLEEIKQPNFITSLCYELCTDETLPQDKVFLIRDWRIPEETKIHILLKKNSQLLRLSFKVLDTKVNRTDNIGINIMEQYQETTSDLEKVESYHKLVKDIQDKQEAYKQKVEEQKNFDMFAKD
jgi:hypothetical protein